MNRILILGVLALSIVARVKAEASVPARAAEVRDAVKAGKPVSLMVLYEDEPAFYYVMERIAEGTIEWLEVAVHLAPTADAHPGEELSNALALALANAPERVLSRTFGPIALGDVCHGPNEVEDTVKYREALKRSMSAVSKVTNTKLVTRRDECLKMLKEALTRTTDN